MQVLVPRDRRRGIQEVDPAPFLYPRRPARDALAHDPLALGVEGGERLQSGEGRGGEDVFVARGEGLLAARSGIGSWRCSWGPSESTATARRGARGILGRGAYGAMTPCAMSRRRISSLRVFRPLPSSESTLPLGPPLRAGRAPAGYACARPPSTRHPRPAPPRNDYDRDPRFGQDRQRAPPPFGPRGRARPPAPLPPPPAPPLLPRRPRSPPHPLLERTPPRPSPPRPPRRHRSRVPPRRPPPTKRRSPPRSRPTLCPRPPRRTPPSRGTAPRSPG